MPLFICSFFLKLFHEFAPLCAIKRLLVNRWLGGDILNMYWPSLVQTLKYAFDKGRIEDRKRGVPSSFYRIRRSYPVPLYG